MASLSVSKPNLRSFFIRRSTTDKLLEDDDTFEAEVDVTPASSPLLKSQNKTTPKSMARSRRSRRTLNYDHNDEKITEQPPFDEPQQSISYGSVKCREIQRQFQLAEQRYLIFLQSIVANIIQPLRLKFVGLDLSQDDMIQFNILFDITLTLYRFHDAALHKLTTYRKRSGSRSRSKVPLFKYYEQFPTLYATYFKAAFKAVTHLSPIITSHPTIKKWFARHCCAVMLLYDTTVSTPYKSFAEILRDISTHCVEQSEKLQQIAISKHFIMNKEACVFRQNMSSSLAKSYINKWHTEYKQKFDLMHLEMTLLIVPIVTEAKMTEDQCVTQLDKLNATMLSLQSDMNKLLQNRVDKQIKQPPVANMPSIEEYKETAARKPHSLTPPPVKQAAPKRLKPSTNQQTLISPPKTCAERPSTADFKRRAPVLGGLGLKPSKNQQTLLGLPSLNKPQSSIIKFKNSSAKQRSLKITTTEMKEKEQEVDETEIESPGLKISIEKFGYKSNHVVRTNGNDPTPVTDREMFKYFKKIDMGKHRILSAELYSDPLMFDMSYSPSASPLGDDGFTFVGGNDDDMDNYNDVSDESSADLSTEQDEDDDDSEYDDSDDSDDDDPFSFMAFLTESANVEQQTIYAKNGYKKLHKLCDTIQGELVKAVEIETDSHVVIKKAEKKMVGEGITVKEGMAEVVAEDRRKEAAILQYLTESDMDMNQYIARYKGSFESDEDCFLVMECVESQINLKQFVQISQKYIKKHLLKLTEYRQCIKRLYWQLAITVHWLHDVMHCCHLDLCLENIMLKDCSFVTDELNGTLSINSNTSVKLTDFGVAEVFEDNDFSCEKTDLSIDNQSYLAPQVMDEDIYDARAADMWCLGMILFHLMTGQKLFEPMEKAQSAQTSTTSLVSSDATSLSSLVSSRKSRSSMTSLSGFMCNGYRAVYDGSLKEFLTINEQVKQFDHGSFGLLIGLLDVKEKGRLNAMQVLKHEWFAEYYEKYKELIQNQTEQNLDTMTDFPFYQM